MAVLMRILMIVAVVGLFIWLIRSTGMVGGIGGGGGSKCKTCKHRRKVFDDGTLCGFGNKETFKNTVHVQNCIDYEKG